MHYYIATRLENHKEHNELRDIMAELGHVISYDWTEHGSVQSEGVERTREVAIEAARGVEKADIVFVILPGGRGTHSELGIAIGLNKRVVLIGNDGGIDGRTCSFYHHPTVTKRYETLRELKEYLCLYIPFHE